MVEIELPEEVQQLIQSFDDNCSEAERQAIDIVSSFEVPVFNVLRDLTARNCYLVLCHLPKWFGQTPTLEHCTCLMVLTEYISCSYNNTDFYGTFVKAKQDKFYETFFVKLSNEWKKVFHKLSCREFTLNQFNSLKKNLKIAFSRFPNNFTYKWILNDILRACDDYGDKLRESLSKPPVSNVTFKPIVSLPPNQIANSQSPKLISQIAVNSNNTFQKPSVIGSSAAVKLVVSGKPIERVTNSVFGEPRKILSMPGRAPPNVNVLSLQSQPIPKAELLNLQSPVTNSQSEVIVIDDIPTPAKIKCKSFAKEENTPNFSLSKMFAEELKLKVPFKSIENSKSCSANSALNQNNVNAQNEVIKPKVLNAFDILMRRSVLKKKSMA